MAVAKAGAAFLPLDPGYPQERLAFMLSDAAARILLTPTNAEVPLSLPGVNTIETSSSSDAEQSAAGGFESPAAAHDLAYVIYTSGSTGQPKGVMIEHAAAVNTLADVSARFAVAASDRVLCLSSFGFDLSVYDVFGVLGAGGALILPCKEEARDPAAWGKLIARHGVTLWNTVPALMELMVSYIETTGHQAISSLRLVLLSGDWIAVSLLKRIRALNPAIMIVSLGGATEAAIWSVHYCVEQIRPSWTKVPYGRALSRQALYVLDSSGRPCPPNTAGELYIGGAGVARGYLNRPDLTAERFVADPFATGKMARLYRTGDLAKCSVDGNIEFLGRADNQIKINGYRIELGEIEAALAEHPRIREVVVVAIQDSAGRRRLVAFFVPTTDVTPTDRELREHLARRLPIYMLPARYVARIALPLTANGKIDRQALSDNGFAAADSERTIAGPKSATEAMVAKIWREVLDLDVANRNERFAEAGGDSLQMVNLILRINATFGINLPATTPMFEAPTIAELASLVDVALQLPRRT
jgi:amino acid adenylation domain-containing protein